jgi:hypothetical protein
MIMGGSQKALVDTLTAVIGAFNTNVVQNVLPYLDPNVDVFRIRDGKKFHGEADSANFLTESFRDNPSFALLTTHIAPSGDDIPAATIQGTATWVDDNSPQGELLNYIFKCGFDDAAGAWLFKSVMGKVKP